MRKIWKKWGALAVAGCMTAGMLSGCGAAEEQVKESLAAAGQGQAAGAASAGTSAPAETLVNQESMFTDRDRSGAYDAADCVKIELNGSDVTIAEEGVYLVSGSLENGMIMVDAAETAKVQLVLDNVEISNSSGAAIYVRQADKVFITLAEGTVNTLSGGDSYVSIDDNNIDAVIFAKSDLTINGSGSLQVTAVTGHGIVSKDDLKVAGGAVTVIAPGHGLEGKDSVRIAAGGADGSQDTDTSDAGSAGQTAAVSLNITAGKDGIHSENADKEDKGFVYIEGGSITVMSEGDGISAGIYLQIDGGTFNLTAGQGSANKTVARDEDGSEVSAKGIKAGGDMIINSGSFFIDSQDDGLHSNSNLTVTGGQFDIATGDDGLHADETTTVAGGTVNISVSYEGIEGNRVVISGGYIRLYATDDGLNAAGGRDGSGYGGMFGGGFGGGFDGGFGGGFDDDFGGGSGRGTDGRADNGVDGSTGIEISGGVIYVNADGDGIDSNGTITVTGGETYVSGPESSANGALDYEGSAQITGGTLVALGNSGMAMNFGESSTQGSVLISTSNCKAGTEVSLEDGAGNVLVSYTAESGFNSLVVSCPGLVTGGTYVIHVGNEAYEVTLDSLIYGNGFGGFGGGPGGFGGDRGGFGEDRDEPRGDWGDGNRGGERPGKGGMQMPGNGEMPQMPGNDA
ncbi:MAG: carbohydrate-binding domain-containing protein [Butyrivibrio sp.]|nr:carbohydrate-binding domain-containing protein [Acetatifactor muris]MCM1558787.1 carbohydrate-binding domain-containing protein [Butyrivibrio sp.]